MSEQEIGYVKLSDVDIRIKALELAVNYSIGINRGEGLGCFSQIDLERMTNNNLKFIKEGKW